MFSWVFRGQNKRENSSLESLVGFFTGLFESHNIIFEILNDKTRNWNNFHRVHITYFIALGSWLVR